MEESPKRRRVVYDVDGEEQPGRRSLSSLTQPISPPRKRIRAGESISRINAPSDGRIFTSPFQLSKIRDLPAESNVDAIALGDILGDPLIAECWQFNFLHNIDFVMSHFDPDVINLVKVHFVHGFWKREDANRLALEEQASKYQNVKLHTAYLPEMFGTHHSKMMILLRHDDQAQVIIHTANMIPRDWRNMTQGIWRSPLLPLRKDPHAQTDSSVIGSGAKFKVDLLCYLRAYDDKREVCEPLAKELEKFDFSEVQGTLIASVPGRHDIHDESPTRWGWAALKEALRAVPTQPGSAEVVVQISSIATLGPTDKWLQQTMLNCLRFSKTPSLDKIGFKVVFPTPDEIRRSLDGYESGASIHTKIQSSQQRKQLQYLKPMFCHWANDAEQGASLGGNFTILEAGRRRAAPHIKTYIRNGEKSIDWALLTSANLSKQAWGEAPNATSQVRIASWEIGVLVWPALFGDGAVMKATHMADTPTRSDDDPGTPIVGLRVPYDLPLQRYGQNETPWVASASYAELDWRGQPWEV